MDERTPVEELPAMDAGDENPDEMVGDEVEPEHTLDLDAFTEVEVLAL